MRLLVIWFAIAALIQPQGRRRMVDSAVIACVSTSPMPVLRFDSAAIKKRYRIPISRPDTSLLERIPVARLRPCYWSDEEK
jgi:hypothetical protein